MLKKSIILTAITVLVVGNLFISRSIPSKAANNANEVYELIEETIDSDREKMDEMPSILQKLYEKLITLFRKAGTLSKDISKVVKMYNALDETSEDYPEKLMEFFEEYNKLGLVKRKVVDFCTGILGAKDKLLSNVRHIIILDLYSERQICAELEGNCEFMSENESVALVDEKGILKTQSTGITKIEVVNETGEKEIFRVFVKKPLLASKVSVKRGNKIKITVVDSYEINKVVSGSNKIKVEMIDNVLLVEGLKKGTAYIYVGTTDGKTVKYKVKVS